MNLPKKSSVALLGAVLLSTGGLVDAILTWWILGLKEGMWVIGQDPGKYLFHVLILPLTWWMFLTSLSIKTIHTLRKAPVLWAFSLASAVLLVLIAAVVSIRDVPKTIEDDGRLPMPVNLSRDAIDKTTEIESRYRMSARSILEKDLEERIKTEKLKGIKADYVEAINQALGLPKQGPRSFMLHSSERGKWTGGLTIVGGCTVALFLWIIGMTTLATIRAGAIQSSVMRMQIGGLTLVSLWFVCRPHSEWYTGLYEFDFSKYGPYTLAGVTAGVALFMIVWRWIGGGESFDTVMIVIGVLLAAVPTLAPGLLLHFARSIDGMSPSELCGLYVVMLFTISIVLWRSYGS